MTDRNRNAMIGLFALGGIICLGWLMVLFGESQGMFKREYFVLAKYDPTLAVNVRAGTEVYLSGVLVGSVGRVELVDQARPSKGLYAVLSIDQRYSIPQSSTAQVVMSLMGQSSVNIKPPDLPEPPEGEALKPPAYLPRDGAAIIRGEVINPLDTVIDPVLKGTIQKTTLQIGDLAEALTPTARALTSLLEPRSITQVESPQAMAEGITANLSTAIERLHRVLRHFDIVLGDPAVQSNVKLTLDNFRAASEDAKVAVESLRLFAADARVVAQRAQGTLTKVDQTVDDTHGHIDELGKRLTENADKLSRLLDQFLVVGYNLSEGQGTAGLLLRDTKFYDELMLTIQRLGGAAAEMQDLLNRWKEQGIRMQMR